MTVIMKTVTAMKFRSSCLECIYFDVLCFNNYRNPNIQHNQQLLEGEEV